MRRRSLTVFLLTLLASSALLAWSGNAPASGQSCTSGVGQAANGPCKKAKATAANRTDTPRSEWSTSCYRQTARRHECTVYSPSNNCTGGMDIIRREGRLRARNVQIDCA